MATFPYRGRPAYRPPGFAPRPAPFFARGPVSDQLYDPRLGLLTAHLFPEPPPLPDDGLLSPKAMALDPDASDWAPADPDKGLLWLAGSPLEEESSDQTGLDHMEPAATNTVASTVNSPSYKPVPLQRRGYSLPMPPYIQGGYKDDWFPFNHDLRRSGMDTEAEIEAGRITFGFEGGMQPDPRAGGDKNPGVAGITKGWLAASEGWKKRSGEENSDPYSLPREMIAGAYKVYIDEALQNIGKGAGLARIRDHTMALEVFDTLFQHGRSGGAVIIQDAINSAIDSLPEKERNKHDLEPLLFRDPKSTRAFGEQTLDRMNRLVEAGYAKELRGAIAELRAIDLPTGNLARYDFFR